MRRFAIVVLAASLLVTGFLASPALAQYGEWSPKPAMSVAGMVWDPLAQQWTQGLMYDGNGSYVKAYSWQTLRFEVRNVDASGSQTGPARDCDTYSSAYYAYEEDSAPVCHWDIVRVGSSSDTTSYDSIGGASPSLEPGVYEFRWSARDTGSHFGVVDTGADDQPTDGCAECGSYDRYGVIKVVVVSGDPNNDHKYPRTMVVGVEADEAVTNRAGGSLKYGALYPLSEGDCANLFQGGLFVGNELVRKDDGYGWKDEQGFCYSKILSRSYLRFNMDPYLPTVPSNLRVSSAKLKATFGGYHPVREDPQPADVRIGAYKCLQSSWSEEGIKWDGGQPSVQSTAVDPIDFTPSRKEGMLSDGWEVKDYVDSALSGDKLLSISLRVTNQSNSATADVDDVYLRRSENWVYFIDRELAGDSRRARLELELESSNGSPYSLGKPSNRIYVDSDAAGNQDGSTWANAFHTVQAALDYSLPGMEIWVAAGTYNECVTLKPSVALYGGFAGTETSLSARPAFPRPSPDSNETVIGSSSGSVVTVALGAKPDTLIDGFTIRNGNSEHGGGIYCEGSSPTIINNTIKGNNATYGGGIYCGYSSPRILNNRIGDNASPNTATSGAGIYCHYSSAQISGNRIVDNTASQDGGGIFAWWCSPVITNNTVAYNESGSSYYGGGVCYKAEGTAPGLYEKSPLVSNNIIAFNTGEGIHNSEGEPALRNNCIYQNTRGNYSPASGPKELVAGEGDISSNPSLVDGANGDYHLSGSSSPCNDAGWSDAPGVHTVDMDYTGRMQGEAVEIGADEVTAPPRVATPVISPSGGSLHSATPVTITCGTPGAVIHYTIDGSYPTTASPANSTGFTVDRSMTIKARAFCTGMTSSALATAVFYVDIRPQLCD